MSDFGLRISKLAKSVLNGVKKDAILTTEYPYLKTHKQGEASLNITGAGTYSIDITHGLGYHPAFVHLQVVDPTNPTGRYLGRFAAQSGADFIGVDSYVTREILRLYWYDNSASPGAFFTYPYKITFYYYIFDESLEDL